MNYADRVRQVLARTTAPARRPAKTGMVPGKTPSPGRDNKTIPAESGEYVIPAQVVAALGKDYFDKVVMDTLGDTKVPSGSPETGFRHGGLYQEYNPNNRNWSNTPAPLAGGGWGAMPVPQTSNPSRIGKDINYQQVVTPTEGGGPGNFAVNPSLFYGDGFSPSGSGFPAIRGGFPHPAGIENRSFNTNPFWQGQPGMPWSPTMIPTTYDPQGYPRAVPVMPGSPDFDSSGPHPHTPPKSNS